MYKIFLIRNGQYVGLRVFDLKLRLESICLNIVRQNLRQMSNRFVQHRFDLNRLDDLVTARCYFKMVSWDKLNVALLKILLYFMLGNRVEISTNFAIVFVLNEVLNDILHKKHKHILLLQQLTQINTRIGNCLLRPFLQIDKLPPKAGLLEIRHLVTPLKTFVHIRRYANHIEVQLALNPTELSVHHQPTM